MVILIALIYYFSPLMGIVSLFWILYNSRGRITWGHIRTLGILISLFLGLINTTKELTGDFLAYKEIYESALDYSYIGYLIENKKEPIYFTFSWLFSRLTHANWAVFVTFFTTVSYAVLYEAIIVTAKNISASKKDVVTAIAFTALFFQTFAMNGNMVRQSISQSFALLFLVYLFYEKKKKWMLAVLSVGVHSASIPVIGMGVIPFIRERLSPKRILLLGLTIIVLAVLFMSLSGLFSKIIFVGYIFMRLNDTKQLTGTDSWQTDVGLNAQFYILTVLIIVQAIYIYIKKQQDTITKESFGIVNVVVILMVFLLILNFGQAYFLCMRYQFFIYTFQSVLLLIFLNKCSFKYKAVCEGVLCIALVPYFCYYYSFGVFKYTDIINVITYPSLLYFWK